MKSEWKVTYKSEGMSTLFGIYRIIDVSIVDHPGNREYSREWYPNQKYAEHAAELLNTSPGEEKA